MINIVSIEYVSIVKPCKWIGLTEEYNLVEITYANGMLKLYVENELVKTIKVSDKNDCFIDLAGAAYCLRDCLLVDSEVWNKLLVA